MTRSVKMPEVVTRVRAMREEDLPAMMRIERLSYPTPWPMWFFYRELRIGSTCRVLDRNGEVAGYGVMRISRGWAHIMNVCVAPEYRGRGLARKMMDHLLQTAADKGASRAWLEVRVDNLPAIRLYRNMGFRVKRRHKGYYPMPRGRRDALVMVRQTRVGKNAGGVI